ncbi:tRNA (adenosine(37)-N6)-threonylcarbamoyltransferase complex ATPase subunit type 1 TsaE [Ornithinimicrobium pratense]|uniref:tRNA threonylcarbamoyladenosine biosynthesis protein TsaE n=1 Tax=Ornithinimicrobium pratense TaxID=2593973 RepID=A0A5J6V1U8_9MICO|nr:tRNA (adenosine(37)-N6)-threonylcarbamoyltransferase complex ATPase subunit type 1 TsaE [Ornithinimicrobium pratense]QFG67799.1 tRNA (adenosine(37)-N6)-threonylcarbamoyltransferase complex ATPase subunit type 1 TsaE [Ornithinimicrobium pratense]
MTSSEVVLDLPTAEDTRALGRRLGSLLRAGDLLVLTGDLGAGKTTLTQGLAEGLGVRGPITSPTFVIARVHPSLQEGPALVHVDAYRLGDGAELDDLDLDESLAESVTVVEWGAGLAEQLTEERLELILVRSGSVAEDQQGRTARLRGVGGRWASLLQQVIGS